MHAIRFASLCLSSWLMLGIGSAASGQHVEQTVRQCRKEEEEDAKSLLQIHAPPPPPWSVFHPNPDVLEWDSEPAAGAETRGTLRVPLDYADGDSPTLELKVRMCFASTQPAPHGLMLFHPGGPGTSDADRDRLFNHDVEYDVWLISQRGIGPDAKPQILCSGSHLPPADRKPPFKISDFTDCPCALPDGTPQIWETGADLDPTNETEVEHLFSQMHKRALPCRNSAKFQLKGKNGKTYNFLDYVGTQLLAQDVDRFREAVGAAKMSVYGRSYGTYVGAVYATSFSRRAGTIVLNGNMPPMPDKLVLGRGASEGLQGVVNRLLLECAARQRDCSLKDPEAEYAEVLAAARARELTARTKLHTDFPVSVGMIAGRLQLYLLHSTGEEWADAIRYLAALSPRSASTAERQKKIEETLDTFCTVQHTATWYHYGICVGPESVGESFLYQTAVLGADLAGGYLVEDAMGAYRSEALRWPATGLSAFVGVFAAMSTWRTVPTPPAPLGRQDVKVLVIGTLQDPLTCYKWSQLMREAFPLGSLVTWQGVGHGLNRAGYDREGIEECQRIVAAYLATGRLPMDGSLCRQRTPVPVALLQGRRPPLFVGGPAIRQAVPLESGEP